MKTQLIKSSTSPAQIWWKKIEIHRRQFYQHLQHHLLEKKKLYLKILTIYNLQQRIKNKDFFFTITAQERFNRSTEKRSNGSTKIMFMKNITKRLMEFKLQFNQKRAKTSVDCHWMSLSARLIKSSRILDSNMVKRIRLNRKAGSVFTAPSFAQKQLI